MQCGSTGLGKMSLKMRVADKNEMTKLPPTEPPEGAFVMYCKTYDPVVWNVWIGLEPEDAGALIRLAFRKDIWVFGFRSLFKIMLSKLGFKKRSKEDIGARAKSLESV